MATETKQSAGKVRPSGNQDGRSKGEVVDAAVKVVKKIEKSNKQPIVDSKHKFVSAVTKTEVRSKATSSSSKTAKTTTTTKTREKKVFSLPGQKYDCPEEREPLRIFYESLSKQMPSSEMAEFWMMEHGLLSPTRAKKAHEKKQRKQKAQGVGTPIKFPMPPSKSESSQKQQLSSKNGDLRAKKRIAKNSDDDDFISSPKRRKGVSSTTRKLHE